MRNILAIYLYYHEINFNVDYSPQGVKSFMHGSLEHSEYCSRFIIFVANALERFVANNPCLDCRPFDFNVNGFVNLNILFQYFHEFSENTLNLASFLNYLIDDVNFSGLILAIVVGIVLGIVIGAFLLISMFIFKRR